MKYTIEKHSKVSLLDGFTKFWIKETFVKFAEKLHITWVGSNWTVTKIVVICGNDWYKAKGVDLLTLASYCVLMDIPIPVYVAISWQKNHTTVALSVLNKRCTNLMCSTPTRCITRIQLTWISLILHTVVFRIRELPLYWRHFQKRKTAWPLPFWSNKMSWIKEQNLRKKKNH